MAADITIGPTTILAGQLAGRFTYRVHRFELVDVLFPDHQAYGQRLIHHGPGVPVGPIMFGAQHIKTGRQLMIVLDSWLDHGLATHEAAMRMRLAEEAP